MSEPRTLAEKWGTLMRGGQEELMKHFRLDDLIVMLDAKFKCPRCGRPDMPLVLFNEHNRSCAFECAMDGAMADYQDQWKQEKGDLEERIDDLEMAARDGLRTIEWFEGWLSKCDSPISYTFRDVAKVRISIAKTIGVNGLGHMLKGYAHIFPKETLPEFKCHLCGGRFDHEHMGSNLNICNWCRK